MLKAAVFIGLLAIASGASYGGRIIGGENAVLGEFPHQVSLRFDGRHTCGGSIIHELYILTAAHCVIGRDVPRKFTVVSGTVSVTDGGEIHKVSKIKYHEKYSPETVENDVAILKLKKPIIFNKNQTPVALPTKDTPAGVKAKFSGWGLDSYPGEVSSKLQKMDVVTYSNDECQKLHDQDPKRSNDTTIKQGMLCAFNKLNIGACKGDSGGPLVVTSINGTVQIGVISWVWHYCALGVPDVYTRIYTYLYWINKHTDNVLHLE